VSHREKLTEMNNSGIGLLVVGCLALAVGFYFSSINLGNRPFERSNPESAALENIDKELVIPFLTLDSPKEEEKTVDERIREAGICGDIENGYYRCKEGN